MKIEEWMRRHKLVGKERDKTRFWEKGVTFQRESKSKVMEGTRDTAYIVFRSVVYLEMLEAPF